MKYGESTFDIIYLLFAIASGIVLFFRSRNTAGRLMGLAALILGAGDAFHLVPRVLNYFVDADFSFWLGTGKLITSITMTVFYVLLYQLHRCLYNRERGNKITIFVYVLAAVRVLICMFPQNGWFGNESNLLWAILRNVPFVLLGALTVIMYFQTRNEIRELSRVWLYVTLSFAFYIPVAVGAAYVPVLGALMLPKTVCYMLLIIAFLRYSGKNNKLITDKYTEKTI